jgi:hypothetical protein
MSEPTGPGAASEGEGEAGGARSVSDERGGKAVPVKGEGEADGAPAVSGEAR